jgi:hypothetical protein
MQMITPFLHNALYPNLYHFTSYQEIVDSGLLEQCVLTKANAQKLFTRVANEDPVVKIPNEVTTLEPTDTIHPPSYTNICIRPEAVTTIEPTAPTPRQAPPPPRRPPTSSIFAPRKPDTLFWSLFIANHGVKAFYDIEHKYMNREIEEKMAIVEYMKTAKATLKSMKLTAAVVQERMGDLLTNRSTTLAMVDVFAIYYNTTIWVVSEEHKCYLEFLGRPRIEESDEPMMCIIYHKKQQNGYSVETDVREATIQSISSGMYRMESWDRPLKGVSAYKTADLEHIVGLLGLNPPEGTKKWKKGDMYHAIQAKLLNIF